MLALAWLLPSKPIDPWSILSPKKVATMIFALTFIQVAGSIIVQFLGARTGTILTGFLGGLISSTATTAFLARKSKESGKNERSREILIFLSTTTAMLFEGLTLLLLGTREVHPQLLIIFIGPILIALIIIFIKSKNLEHVHIQLEHNKFNFIPILKLSVFIIAILALSKVLQNIFGKAGLLVLTFLVSLFEIHGSIIANIELHDTGFVSVRLLGTLFSISILASYISKIFLIWTLGTSSLRSQAIKSTLFLFLSIFLSWLCFLALT